MKQRRRQVYLDPVGYRRRRLMDAARLLPVLGIFLFLLPTLWPDDPGSHRTAADGLYLFSAWGLLIVLARLFAPGLTPADAPAPDWSAQPGGDPGGGSGEGPDGGPGGDKVGG